ncbi:hypothetical protein [Reinekea sp. G2M2-21]|uniref:hypothetical protein n=1 Tax=Reinekea sp. G2M2-21 TaxID=2788942 RepID=UPI0018A9751A|nr:hypothetical protein [Reinekea sp. G2M2-21]
MTVNFLAEVTQDAKGDGQDGQENPPEPIVLFHKSVSTAIDDPARLIVVLNRLSESFYKDVNEMHL